MSTEHKLTCDHCGSSTLAERAERWVDLKIGHVCPACIDALAAFLPGTRAELTPFARHDKTVPLATDVRVLPQQTLQLNELFKEPFTPRRLVIEGRPDDWVVQDIKIGNRSQFQDRFGFPRAKDHPGALFAEGARDNDILFETCQTGMGFAVVATYVGTNPEGAALRCRIEGLGHGFKPESPTSV